MPEMRRWKPYEVKHRSRDRMDNPEDVINLILFLGVLLLSLSFPMSATRNIASAIFGGATHFGMSTSIVTGCGHCLSGGLLGILWASVSHTGPRQLRFSPPRFLFFALLFFGWSVRTGEAVTCYTCYDQCPGCTGDATCPFLTTPTANRAIMSGAALVAGAATAVSVLHLMPLRFVRVLSRSVLDAMKTVARRPPAGTPIDLGPLTNDQLLTAVTTGATTHADALREVLTRLGGNPSAAEVARLNAIQSTLVNLDKMGGSLGTSGVTSDTGVFLGAFTFAYVQAAKIARGNSGRTTAAGSVDASDNKETDSKVIQEKIIRPVDMGEFAEFLSTWQMICHALGLGDVLITGALLRDVVFDTMRDLKKDWRIAHELFLVYLDVLETTADPTVTIANVFYKGSQDTHMTRAMQRAREFYPGIFRGGPSGLGGGDDGSQRHTPGGDAVIKFNGAWNTKATTKCITFNLGKKEHPAGSLNPNGSCKHLHACDQWVTGKGPKGQCGGPHPRTKCTNPNKCDSPAEA